MSEKLSRLSKKILLTEIARCRADGAVMAAHVDNLTTENSYLKQTIKDLLGLIKSCDGYLVMAALHGCQPTLEESKDGEAIVERAKIAAGENT